MNDPATLAYAIRSTEPLLMRFLEGFDDTNRTAQRPGLPNHLSWTLGHLALVMHRAADYIDGFNEPQQLPTSDWIHGDGTAGDPSRYDTESVCKGSVPITDASKYPRLVRAVDIHHSAISRLAASIETAKPASLAREVHWGKTPTTPGSIAMRMVFHNGTHAGQLVDLRRALGLGPALG